MNLQTFIENDEIQIYDLRVAERYYICKNPETGRFYFWSSNGFDGEGWLEYSDLFKAMAEVKKRIKNYFKDRGEANPKGW